MLRRLPSIEGLHLISNIKCMQLSQAKKIKTQDGARQFAMDWQKWSTTQNLSWGDLAEWTSVFEELAVRFNLEEEFNTNGII